MTSTPSHHNNLDEPGEEGTATIAERLKVTPFSSTVDSPFWVKYNHEKLNRIKLSEALIDLYATYGVDGVGSPKLRCQESSLQITPSTNIHIPNERVLMKGKLMGVNTMDKFQKLDKNKVLHDFFIPSFLDGHMEALTSFLLLLYADLKNHKVFYWFGIPTLFNRKDKPILVYQRKTLSQVWTEVECEALAQQITAFRISSLQKSASDGSTSNGLPPYFLYMDAKCLPLSKESFLQFGGDVSNMIFGFFDPIGYSASPETPVGWPIRNLVAYLSFHMGLGGKYVKILSYRVQQMRRLPMEALPTMDPIQGDGQLLTIRIPEIADYQWEQGGGYKVVGWEVNARGKAGPRTVNLQPLLDERHLAVQAADLNLKLMKWRMIPDLALDKLHSQRVLLIGAGTLGCNVARVLMGWGVRKITFVDNGKVSYSNPVRQPLFTMNDCKTSSGEGKFKAIAAAEALHAIAPDVESKGIVLSIPMPGHEETKDSIETSVSTLDGHFQESDVIFLLTDTRESRWLPTVLAAVYDKPLFNAALGLDSWLVMRHGGGLGAGRLGCYFCNDVVAPENSTKNRTLDQQCTVTRPGLAPIASAMAAEMMISLLHHPDGVKTPAPAAKSDFSPTLSTDDSAAGALGIIPHQIRGSLVSYTMMMPTVPAFSSCTGCSEAIIKAYQTDPYEFIFNSCQSIDGTYLDDISGLAKFRSLAAENLAGQGDWDDDEF
jgi:ubiquitin-like modifier-activating enzyme ATG7